jgi:16S rRNA (cytidine1402-2'-O)-methyltransferase
MGKLYIVSTPIGNLEDITIRAKRVLAEVEIIACEDTRRTGLLLNQVRPVRRSDLVAKKPLLISYYEENESVRIPQIISLLKQGKNVALVSNAGTPTISDPGFKLVRECINQGIQVEAIPGPSAILTALVSSGLRTDKFLFLGYLPKKQTKRKALFQNIDSIYRYIEPTIVFFESPYRLVETLKDLQETFGDIEIVICRELTKIHEEIRREKANEAITHFEKVEPRGEFTLLFNIPQE